jgi:hypothetical protein
MASDATEGPRLAETISTRHRLVSVLSQVASIAALEMLATVLAHLNVSEARADLSPRVPMLIAIRDNLAQGLREEP